MSTNQEAHAPSPRSSETAGRRQPLRIQDGKVPSPRSSGASSRMRLHDCHNTQACTPRSSGSSVRRQGGNVLLVRESEREVDELNPEYGATVPVLHQSGPLRHQESSGSIEKLCVGLHASTTAPDAVVPLQRNEPSLGELAPAPTEPRIGKAHSAGSVSFLTRRLRKNKSSRATEQSASFNCNRTTATNGSTHQRRSSWAPVRSSVINGEYEVAQAFSDSPPKVKCTTITSPTMKSRISQIKSSGWDDDPGPVPPGVPTWDEGRTDSSSTSTSTASSNIQPASVSAALGRARASRDALDV